MARKQPGQGRLSRRQKTWIGIIVATGTICALLYWEQIALLYVLATLALTALLIVVAMADLGVAQVMGRTLVPAETIAVESGDIPPDNVTKSTFGGRKRKRRG